jgi:hypothetical protein
MPSIGQERILDFAPIGMWWEITKTTADTGGELFEAINVQAGFLDVCVGDQWRQLAPGEKVTVPAGTPRTLKNSHKAEVRLINVHKPALAFERFFRRFHALASSGRLKLPPTNLGSVILISMLFLCTNFRRY